MDFWEILKVKNYILLDGALATELERRGFDLKHPLWSAKILLQNPEAIQAVHYDYLNAGCDCLITSSYQASFPGFAKEDLSEEKIRELLLQTVQLAENARQEFLRIDQPPFQPLIAASIGPYGAFLANGSEYEGNYSVDDETLRQFHAKRIEVLCQSQADFLAFETIPCMQEARVLLEILKSHSQKKAWFSFSCRSDKYISSGEPIADVAKLLKNEEQVIALGVNCTLPRYVASVIRKLKQETNKPLLAYPNSGEKWDKESQSWTGGKTPDAFAKAAQLWYKAGARIIGGCCRTTPDHIRRVKHYLDQFPVKPQ